MEIELGAEFVYALMGIGTAEALGTGLYIVYSSYKEKRKEDYKNRNL